MGDQTPNSESMPGVKNNSGKELRWHFWFLVAFSAFLLITFVYYLPQRFLHEAGVGHEDAAHHEKGDAHAGHELPDATLLAKLPLRTPADRVQSLPFVLRDGVKEFRLEASEFRWEYADGRWVHVWGYNGQIPGPEIRVSEGDRVRIIFKNNLPDATTVHWHGVDLDWKADGVAGITQEAIRPGEEYVYEFIAGPSGTRFYHTHGKDHETSAQQLDMGLAGPLIIEPKSPAYSFDREFTIVLDEWEILDGVNTSVSHVHGAAEAHGQAIPDFNTFTFNGRVYPYTDTIKVKSGEKVLIRFINAGTDAVHPMHLHGHNFRVVAYDGNVLEDFDRRNTITLHPGETADILVDANNPGPWLLHCHNVHHAAAGMVTLFQYDGFDPIGASR